MTLVRFLTAVAIAASATAAFADTVERRPPVEVQPVVHYRKRPGPRFMMPLKIDLGYAGVTTPRGFAPGIGGAIGVHWASLSPRPTDFDIGVGVFGAIVGAPADPNNMAMDTGIAYGGAYLEAGHTLAQGDFWRTWATARGEYVGSSAFGATHSGFGGAGRLSAELYTSGVGIEPSGVFLGSYAIGVYVEAAGRDLGPNIGHFGISTGLTFRTPLVFAP